MCTISILSVQQKLIKLQKFHGKTDRISKQQKCKQNNWTFKQTTEHPSLYSCVLVDCLTAGLFFLFLQRSWNSLRGGFEKRIQHSESLFQYFENANRNHWIFTVQTNYDKILFVQLPANCLVPLCLFILIVKSSFFDAAVGKINQNKNINRQTTGHKLFRGL